MKNTARRLTKVGRIYTTSEAEQVMEHRRAIKAGNPYRNVPHINKQILSTYRFINNDKLLLIAPAPKNKTSKRKRN